MTTRKLLGALAMAAALTGGAAVGAIAGAPLVSGAQDRTTTVAPEQSPGQNRGHGRHPGLRGMKVEAAAEAIGIGEAELRDALRDGRTLGEIADENGVDRQAVVDALVAAGNQQLDELKASLPERMEELVDRRPGDREGRRGRFGHRSGG